jgi:hypothetical protein
LGDSKVRKQITTPLQGDGIYFSSCGDVSKPTACSEDGGREESIPPCASAEEKEKGDCHNIINLRNREVEEVEEGCYVQALSFLPYSTFSTSRFKILRFPSPCGVSHFVKFMML